MSIDEDTAEIIIKTLTAALCDEQGRRRSADSLAIALRSTIEQARRDLLACVSKGDEVRGTLDDDGPITTESSLTALARCIVQKRCRATTEDAARMREFQRATKVTEELRQLATEIIGSSRTSRKMKQRASWLLNMTEPVK